MYIITKKYHINYNNIKYICLSDPIDGSDLYRMCFDFGENSLVSYFKTKEDMDKAFIEIQKCVFYGNPGINISEFEK